MYILLCTYVKPLEEVDKVLSAHRDYLHAKIKSGELIVAGRRNPRVGGVLLVKANSLAEAKRVADEDPFTASGVANFDIIEWTPTVMSESVKEIFALV